MTSAKNLLLQTLKHLGVFALCRALTRRRPRILCYHGGSIGDESEFNAKLFYPRGLLEQRLLWLQRKGFVPAGLDDLDPASVRAASGTPVVITLDDGWYSSATDLLPVLAQHGHRPVLYLATNVFMQGTPVLDVSIRYILWKSALATVVLMDLDENLDGAYDLGKTADRARLCDLAEQWLAPWLHDVPRIHTMLETLAAALGVSANELDLPSRRFSYMRRDELIAAAAAGCRIELHGHAHLYAPGKAAQNRQDILACRQHIVNAGLPYPRHYCYPSGEYDAEAAQLMREIDIATATTCIPGLVDPNRDEERAFLPRFLDGGSISMIEFEAEMSGTLAMIRKITGRAVDPVPTRQAPEA